MIRFLLKLLRLLNSKTDPSRLSLGLCFGMFPGFTPLWRLHNAVTLILMLVFRANFSAFLTGFFASWGVTYAVDPLVRCVGLVVLESRALHAPIEALSGSPLGWFVNFSDPAITGGVALGGALFLPLFVLFRGMIVNYRAHAQEWIEKSRLSAFLRAIGLYWLIRKIT